MEAVLVDLDWAELDCLAVEELDDLAVDRLVLVPALLEATAADAVDDFIELVDMPVVDEVEIALTAEVAAVTVDVTVDATEVKTEAPVTTSVIVVAPLAGAAATLVTVLREVRVLTLGVTKYAEDTVV